MRTLTDSKYFTVSELNHLVKEVINMGFPSAIWVCGEIQGYNRNKGRNHIFFELCEKDPNSKSIVAKIGLVIFSGRKTYIKEILKNAENAFELKDDIEVKFLCKIDYYPPHGAMRLIVETMDPIYTLGKIAQEKQKLIAKLKAEGILEQNKMVLLPEVPLSIGLISAYDSAAYNDFLHELEISGYGFKIYYKSALMQGKGTEKDVCGAIKILNKMANLDCLIITRGGGSVADLSWFDNEKIARAIAGSRLPVLSGIGHEIDITVTDMTAHTYQKTPTAIAQFLVQRVENFLSECGDKVEAILTYARQKIERDNKHMKQCALQLQAQTTTYLKTHHQYLIRYLEIIKKQPLRLLIDSAQQLDRKDELLAKSTILRVKEARVIIQNYERLVEMAKPSSTIKRGFSISRRKGGKVLRSVRQVKPFDEIETELCDGIVLSRVENAT